MTFEQWLVKEYGNEVTLSDLLSLISIDALYRFYEESLKMQPTINANGHKISEGSK